MELKKVRCFDPDLEVCDFIEICVGDPCVDDFYDTSKEKDLEMLKEDLKCKIKEIDNYIYNLKYWENIIDLLEMCNIEYICMYWRWELK